MKFYINLFSPDTHNNYSLSDRSISGFRENQEATAKNIKPGDKFICYVTKLSRWVGILEITSEYFKDDKPIFVEEIDPFIVRFKVKPVVWLSLDQGVPIHEDIIWKNLSFTKNLEKNDTKWTGRVRGSLNKLEKRDGEFLEHTLLKQNKSPKDYPLSNEDRRKLKSLKVKTLANKEVIVSVPEDDESTRGVDEPLIRESIRIQALIAEIGEKMQMKVWLPKSDRAKVLEIWRPNYSETLLESLPLNYDDTTLKTIENIDVLWIKRRSIVRAFEVEHTTSIYSGILRMADLMALQPNLDIKAHIIAPSERREKVLQEITRPVFTLLEKGPLTESCTFISYDSIIELSKEKRLEYMSAKVLEEFSENGEI